MSATCFLRRESNAIRVSGSFDCAFLSQSCLGMSTVSMRRCEGGHKQENPVSLLLAC
ncbi:hypothetical protein CSUI_008149 [Cystoisospora suis]|uniref:Uncharacterized protein n=1 Tax=Cystoisospora suis TaxID=483139 RepID=A0A2C6KLM5_9APIC|nr:hypothetical protein CSUI_008149 [Cystoisospora suis]